MIALPAKLQDRIENPTTEEGQRHAEMISVVLQMVGNGVPDDEIFRTMRGNYPTKPEKEIRDSIRGAHRRDPAPTAGRKLVVTKPKRPAQPVAPLAGNAATIAALEAAFLPNEIVCMTNSTFEQGGGAVPSANGNFLTCAEWVSKLKGGTSFDGEHGAWICLNPLKGKSRKSEDVAAFRHALIEFDQGDTATQQKQLLDSCLPITVMAYSGAKSIHAWVKVNAKDKAEFAERWRRACSVFDNSPIKPDGSTKDAGRFARLPGALRNGVEQRLIALNIGPASWADWETQVDVDICQLPAIRNAAEGLEWLKVAEVPEELVAGILHKGSKMILGGSSKSHKTWALLDLAISVATGFPWLGANTSQSKVLFINCEIQEVFFYKRIEAICQRKGVPPPQNLFVQNLRGHSADISLIVPKILKLAEMGEYGLFIFDPIYKLLGDRDENSAGNMTQMLNQLETLAVESGAAVVFAHHFTKGDASGKRAIDRVSGSGVFGRDPDSCLSLTAHEEEHAFVVEAELRNFPPLPAFTVRWQWPLLERDSSLDVTKLKRVNGRAPVWGVKDLLGALGDKKMRRKDWLAECEKEGMTVSTFNAYSKKLRDGGEVVKSPDDPDLWMRAPKNIYRIDHGNGAESAESTKYTNQAA